MSWLDGLRHRIRVLLTGDRYRREQADERALHRDLERTAQARGTTHELDPLGPPVSDDAPAAVAQSVARTGPGAWFERLSYDARYGLRGLARSPGFAATVVITLALGVGANAAVFSFLDRVFVRPPDGVEAPGGIRRVYHQFDRQGEGTLTFGHQNYPSYATIRSAMEGYADVVAYTAPASTSLGSDDESVPVNVSYVTDNYFSTLGVRPVLGRLFTPAETQIELSEPVAVISEELWASAFARDSGIVGRTIERGRARYTVVGVAGNGFAGIDISTVQLFLPLGVFPVEPQRGVPWYRGSGNYLTLFARMRPSANESQALDRASIAYNAQPQIDGYRRDSNTVLVAGPISAARGPADQGQEVTISTRLAGVALLVLLIACANVANLLLVRAITRRREIAVRLAMGVSRGKLAAQLLTESLIIAGLGGMTALFVAVWGGEALRRALLPGVKWAGGAFDLRIVAFTAAVSVAVGVAAGLAPVLQSGRTNVIDALKSGVREGAYQRSRLRSALLVVQTALAVVLVIGAGLFVSSLSNVRAIRVGYDVDSIAYVSMPFSSSGPDVTAIAQALQSLGDRIKSVDGVRGVAYSSGTPMGGWTGFQIGLPGRDSIPRLDGPNSFPMMNWVSASFFSTVGMRIVAGRAFSDSDMDVVVVNETLARTFWPGEDPIGKCILMPRAVGRACVHVVGVAENAARARIIEEPNMQFFMPRGLPRALIIRVDPARASAIVAYAQSEMRALLPGARAATAVHLRDRVQSQLRPWRLGAALFTVFGVLALVVAAVGVYSVIAYSVTQRTYEMGVRIALGAQAADVLRLVVGQGARVLIAGVALGIAAALAAGKLVASLLYGVTARDPRVMILAAIAVIAVGVVACLVPAFRAARVNPLVAMRAD